MLHFKRDLKHTEVEIFKVMIPIACIMCYKEYYPLVYSMFYAYIRIPLYVCAIQHGSDCWWNHQQPSQQFHSQNYSTALTAFWYIISLFVSKIREEEKGKVAGIRARKDRKRAITSLAVISKYMLHLVLKKTMKRTNF